MDEQLKTAWARLPSWAVLGAGLLAAAALALQLTDLLLHPLDASMRSAGATGAASGGGLSFAQIHLAFGGGLILAAAGMLAQRFAGLVMASIGVVVSGVAVWAWYRNPLSAQLARAGVARDLMAAAELAPFYGAGPLARIALVLYGVLLIWVVVLWVRLLGRAG